MTAPLKTISVGIVVERHKASSQWVDYLWRPIAALGGVPQTRPWTVLSEEGDVTTFYAGAVRHARYLRDRFTFLDLAGDSGMLAGKYLT